MTGQRRLIGATLAACLGFVGAFGATAAPLEEELVGADLPADVRAFGMAGATVGRARNMDALFTNPAGLGASSDSEFAFSGMFRDGQFKSAFGPNLGKASLSDFRVGNIGFVYHPDNPPRLGVGVAFRQVRDLGFHSLLEGTELQGDFTGFDILDEKRTTGHIYALTMGIGFEVAPGIRLGASTDFWDGERETAVDFIGDDTTDRDGSLSRVEYDDDYLRDISGARVKLGVELGFIPMLTVGGTLTLPTEMDIHEDWSQLTSYTFDNGQEDASGDSGITDYTLRLPMEWTGGVAVRLDALRVYADARYVNWQNAEYSPPPARDVSRDNFSQYYDASIESRLGAELSLFGDAAVRGGIYLGSQPLSWKDTIQSPVTLTLGGTIPVLPSVLLDAAYAWTRLEREEGDASETQTTHRLVAGARLMF